MIDIEMHEMDLAFLRIWQAAGEHLSFRLGNQLFFVRVEDADARVQGPGSMGGLRMIARGCRGHACLMPMRRGWSGSLSRVHPGWGLADTTTGRPVNPVELVTDERIEMTDWELQDLAVQVVRRQLEKQGSRLMSWQSNPRVDPAIWFVGASGGPEWVVVRACRYPANRAGRPGNWQEIAAGCARQGAIGHFGSVALASTAQPFKKAGEDPVPLWRGHDIHVSYAGLT